MATSIKTIWPSSKIRDLCDVCRGSSPRPIADQRYFERGDIPWIKIADATKSEKFLYETKEYVNEYGASFSRFLPAGTIIVAASGTLGYTQILGVPGCAHDGWLILTNLRNFDRDYAYYVLQQMKKHFYNSAYGAAIQNINTEILRETEIPCPPFPIQRKIGAILSAYDDLIENNTRRIAILEEMARRIYEEWFVNFRFPGHEKARMVESKLGLFPEEWRATTLENLTKFISRGITPKYDEEALSLVINQKCIRDQKLNFELARRQSKQVSKEKLIRIGDVLINSTGVGTLGRVAQVYENVESCTVDTHVTIARATDNIDIDYFGLSLLRLESHFEQEGVGATGQTELGRQRIGATPIILPSQPIQTKFGSVVRPLRQHVQNLMKKNTNLRTTRDLLLPKLISGEIDVSEVRTVAEKAVAA